MCTDSSYSKPYTLNSVTQVGLKTFKNVQCTRFFFFLQILNLIPIQFVFVSKFKQSNKLFPLYLKFHMEEHSSKRLPLGNFTLREFAPCQLKIQTKVFFKCQEQSMQKRFVWSVWNKTKKVFRKETPKLNQDDLKTFVLCFLSHICRYSKGVDTFLSQDCMFVQSSALIKFFSYQWEANESLCPLTLTHPAESKPFKCLFHCHIINQTRLLCSSIFLMLTRAVLRLHCRWLSEVFWPHSRTPGAGTFPQEV